LGSQRPPMNRHIDSLDGRFDAVLSTYRPSDAPMAVFRPEISRRRNGFPQCNLPIRQIALVEIVSFETSSEDFRRNSPQEPSEVRSRPAAASVRPVRTAAMNLVLSAAMSRVVTDVNET